MFDLVVPVFNALHHVRTCLLGIQRHATLPYRLWVIDDASAWHTAAEVQALVRTIGPHATYLRNAENLGYLQTANRGGREGRQPHLIFINSDTFVPPGFLERTRNAFASDPKIGVVTAMSNWANWTRLCWTLPPGHNVYSLSRALTALSASRYPDINNAYGFFFAVARDLFDQLEGFDPAYGKGYWEEADFCMKALAAGRRVVVDDGLFVFHHGWGSFQEAGRDANMDANQQIFMARWRDDYARITRAWQAQNPVAYMEPAVLAKQQNHPTVLDQHHLTDAPESAAQRHPISEAEAAREIQALKLGLGTDAEPAPTRTAAAPGQPLRVCYILPGVKLYGGIISVMQVVNQLILQGIDANIVTYGEIDTAAYQLFPTLFSAYSFPSQEAMVAHFPDCDLIVATSWDSVYPAAVLARHRPDVRLVYFVQDFEPDFYLDGHADLAQLAEQTYSLIPDKIVKTRWLAKRMQAYPGRVHRIPLGLNLDYFYDRGTAREAQILALGRPKSVRRNFPMLVDVFTEIHRRRPGVRLALYGFGYDTKTLPFPCVDYGKLTRMEEIARALNESSILLDCSTFQGFGRPGLEAMACGTLAVLTQEGGITQYAKHDYNCLLIDPLDRDVIVSTLMTALDNPQTRQRLVATARTTAEDYSLVAEGRRTAALLRAVVADQTPEYSDDRDWDRATADESATAAAATA